MKIVITLVLFLLSILNLPAEIIRVIGPDYTIDLPEGWHSVSKYNSESDSWNVSFTNSFSSAFLNITTFPGEQFSNSREMYDYVKKELKAEGEAADFTFSGMEATLADMHFKVKNRVKRGYFVFINGNSYDYALISFTDSSIYKKNIDEILSAIDSFSPQKDNDRKTPGPIGQFLYPTTNNKNNSSPISKSITIGKHTYLIPFEKEEIEATQALVEREARILTHYKGGTPLAIAAWKRFYRMIYRDNYHRLDRLYSVALGKSIKNFSREKLMRETLKWIQGFSYSRTNTISDLLSPLATAFNQSGDCDSRALLFIILTHQMGIDSILLVSSKYSHSAVGLGIEAKGAKIRFKDKNYVYTETTDKVEIGMVPTKMADPSGWIRIKLSFSNK